MIADTRGEPGTFVEAEVYLTRVDHDSTLLSAAERRDSAPAISMEALAYVALALAALLLRVSSLDIVPISDLEAEGALHAWHTIEDDAPGAYAVSSSPITYLTQLISFSLLGANEFGARIGAAIAGTALALSPLLFRESLGRTRTFVWAALLTLLTAPTVSSRAADGSAFMMLSAVLAIWLMRRYWYSQKLSDAGWAIAAITFMLLLSSPSGIPLLAIILVAGWLAVWRTALSAPQRLGLPGDDILQLAVKRLRAFPVAAATFVPLLIAFLISTAFMFNPAGLRTVSQLFNEAIRGLSHSSSLDGTRLGFVALFAYEPLLIIFALGGAWLLWKKGDITYVDRFAAAWSAIGAFALLLYPGAKASDAMWAVLPLTLLASYGITQLMVDRRVVILWAADEDDIGESALYSPRYRWVKWAVSAGVFMFLLILSVQFMQIARLLLQLPEGTAFGELFPLLLDASQLRLLHGIGLFLITAIIALIIFLFTANYWGLGTCLQGIGLGFLWLMLISGVGGAWHSAIADAATPRSLWQQRAVSADAYLLRQTLFDLADQDTSGFPLLEIVIVRDAGGILENDGLVAWLARDFPNARFVNKAQEAAGAPIVLIAQHEEAANMLEGNYVGQRFLLRRSWRFADLGLWDLPAWWSQGRLRESKLHEEHALLWLRQDVYDGVSIVQH